MKLLNSKGEEIPKGEKIDLGIVEAGKIQDYVFYLYNPEIAEVIDIEVMINNPEVSILVVPKKMSPESKGELKIRWSPSMTVKKGLKAEVEIKAKELYG
jgi:hypothetical protein